MRILPHLGKILHLLPISPLHRELEEQARVLASFQLSDPETSRSLCELCTSISFKDLASGSGFDHQPAGKRLRREYDSETGCALCTFLWKALIEDLNKTYSDGSTENFASKRRYIIWDSGEPFVGHDDFKTKAVRFAALEQDPIKLFLNPLQDEPWPCSSELAPKAYQFRELSVWSASASSLEKINWRSDRYLEEASYREPKLVDSLLSLTGESVLGDVTRLSGLFTSATFRVETTWVDPLSQIVVHKPVPSDMKSRESIEMIHAWLRRCVTAHKNCPEDATNYLPTRLIDVGDSDGTMQPRLCVSAQSTTNFLSQKPSYIALSYCWGSKTRLKESPPMTTTSSTIADHMNSIPIETLPRTIADAVVLTRLLGVRYLWVDSLCILQGDDEAAREDWARESSTMSSVYGGALLTVCAAWGLCVHDGIFTPRNHTQTDGISLSLNCAHDPSRSGRVRLGKPLEPFIDSLDQPLYHRAWTLQERLLSPRVLICNEDQFAWECQTENLTESGHKMKSIGAMRLDAEFLQGAKENANVFPDTWQCIATDYSSRSLTKSSDKLPALAGIARRFHELNRDHYLAGIWKQSVLDDLLWVHEGINYVSWYRPKSQKFPGVDLSAPAPGRPGQYRAPSWSWAAVDGPVRWPLASDNRKGDYYAKILDWKVVPKSLDKFGEVIDGHLLVQAPLGRIPLTAARKLLYPKLISWTRLYPNLTPWTRYWEFYWMKWAIMDEVSDASVLTEQDLEFLQRVNLALLMIKGCGALILEEDKKRPAEEGQISYKRVGVVARENAFWSCDPNFCVETICRIY